MRFFYRIAILLTVLLLSPIIYAVPKSNSAISHVTVFQNQAKVTRVISITENPGTHHITFSQLPIKLIPSTLRAYTDNKDDISILGLTYQTITDEIKSNKDPSDIIHTLDTLINIKEPKLKGYLESFTEQKQFLSQFTSTSKTEIEKNITEGAIDMDTWNNAFQFIGKNIKNINDSINYYNRELKICRKQISDFKFILKQIQKKEYNRSKSVDVTVLIKKNRPVTIYLEYLIPDASWNPVYNARLDMDKSKVSFTLMADIKQNSGEDWSNVAVSISSTNPTESVGSGQLIPWYIGRYIDFSLYNGMYGQITGSLFDKETNQPIYGASITIQNTSFGAISGTDGNFLIKKLEPGVYNLKITHLEYNTIEIQDVIVLPEDDEPYKFYLNKKITGIGEEIYVTAHHDVLDKFKTQNEVMLSKEVIERQPVTTVDELLTQVSGVVTDGSGYYIHGGRAFEVGYITDGVSVMNSNPSIKIHNKLLTPVSSQNFLLKEGVKLDRDDFKTTFHLTQKESIPSGTDAKRVFISENILPCKVEAIARPKRKEHVFRLARITNLDNLPLFSGLVQLFVDSDFIGKAVIADFIAPNQEFELPFGIDKTIEIKRSIVDYKKEFGKSDIKLSQQINIAITNNSAKDIELIIEEPLPVTVDKEVKIDFGDIFPEDFTLFENGIAQWVSIIKPNMKDTISIPFKIKYPNNINVTGIE
ncbi:MAG: mucoidy inhibitor MuiA family protein [Calditrichaeota bacterium]|nr:MAG: mucoidy inhibitor MuiA family protein [Calditrichota bacterium]